MKAKRRKASKRRSTEKIMPGNEELLDDKKKRKQIVKIGECGKGTCGEYAACKQMEYYKCKCNDDLCPNGDDESDECNNDLCKGSDCKEFRNFTYTCLCTDDSLPPYPDGSCPRKIVRVEPALIPNVQPPSNKDNPLQSSSSSSTSTSNTTTMKPSTILPDIATVNYLLYSMVASLSLLFVVVCIGLFLRKYFRRRRHADASPINLKHGLLMADRYAPNPQYSACSGAGVAVLKNETLQFFNEIGEGCFGKVYKGELLIEGSDRVEIVAIKVLKENASREAEEDFFREVEIMSTFRHPNILSLLGMVIREGLNSPMMVFEYMPHGDLAELLRAQKKSHYHYEDQVPQLKQKHLLSIALQIASGMMYLAAQRFVHRDLACRNCLVAEGPVVKIADFGMSRDVYTCDYYKIGGSRLLPVRWMSPESVLYGRFTLESDIWSYGVLLWEIYSYGKQPYYGHTNEQAVKLILDGIMLIPPDDCPSLVCELMKNCWKTEPRDRIRFPNIYDKLELAYESCKDRDYDDDSDNNDSTSLRYENETVADLKGKISESVLLGKSLPRPPPLMKTFSQAEHDSLLDAQGYLLPNIREQVQYLETLPD